MSLGQNINDSSLSTIDITPDYQAEMNQLLHEAQMGLHRLSHNITHFNGGLQTMVDVGEQFAYAVCLWKSFHMSIKMTTSDSMKCDEGDKNSDIEHLNFKQTMLEKEAGEDEKRDNRQQEFEHSTINEAAVLDSLFFEKN